MSNNMRNVLFRDTACICYCMWSISILCGESRILLTVTVVSAYKLGISFAITKQYSITYLSITKQYLGKWCGKRKGV